MFRSALNQVFSVGITIHCLSFISGSQLAKVLFPSENIYHEGPKHWHEYVRAHLFHSVQNIKTNLTIGKKTIASNALIFFTLVSRHTNIGFENQLDLQDVRVVYIRPTLLMNLNKSSLSLLQQSKLSFHLGKLRSPQITWFVHLDSFFASKLPIFYLSIPTKNMKTCMMGYLKLYQCSKYQNNANTFCGGHSSTETFVPHRNICFQLWLLHICQFSLDIFFSVSDNVVISLFPPPLPNIYTHSSSGLRIIGKVYISSFVIQVKLSNRIKIEKTQHPKYMMKVFDGPGTLSAEIENIGNSFYTSTFQCLVMFGQLKFRENYQIIFFTFDQKINEEIFLTENNPRKVMLPNKRCGRFCILWLGTLYGWYFNITIDKISFNGNDAYTCAKGGLALGQFSPKESGVLSILCQNFSATDQQKRSLYTREPQAYIFLYSYNHYSEIEAHLTLDVMKCHFLPLSPCLHYQYCGRMQHQQCRLDFSGIEQVQFTKVQGFRDEGKYRGLTLVYKPVFVHVCMVFQFTGISDHVLQQYQGNPADCVTQLLPDYLHHNQKRTFHHNIRAFLEFGASTLQNLTISYQNHDRIHVPDQTQIIASHQSDNGTWVMDRPRLFTQGRQFHWSRKTFYATNYFHDTYVHAHSQTVAHQRRMLEICYTVHPDWSSSWMDVTFWMSDSEKPWNTQLLPGGIIMEQTIANPVDLTSGLYTQSDNTIKFKYMHNLKNLQAQRYLYTCALAENFKFVKWSVRTTVKSIVEGYELSLPQTRVLLMCCLHQIGQNNKCNPCRKNFRSFLVNQRYQGFSQGKPTKCTTELSNLNKCFFITHLHHHNFVLLWFLEPKSWYAAHSVCKSQAAHLPTFFDVHELDEFLTLLKYWKEPLMNEAIFIGLVEKNNNTTKVCTSNISFCPSFLSFVFTVVLVHCVSGKKFVMLKLCPACSSCALPCSHTTECKSAWLSLSARQAYNEQAYTHIASLQRLILVM